MSTTSKETWQKLADSWVGIAPEEAHFESWMSLNLHPPLEGHLPAEWVARVKADPRASAFARRYLRSSFKWESTWVDWMPNSDVAALVLEPKESLERAMMLSGALCCRQLISVSISKAVRIALVDALGSEVLQRLSARPALGRMGLPDAVLPLAWALKPAETLRRSGLLCLRLAVSPFPSGMEARLAAILPDSAWKEAMPAFSTEDPKLAMEVIAAARKLDHSL
jgi:YOP proteins translocation protein K (YscK)